MSKAKPTKTKRTTVPKAGKTPGGNLVPQKHGGAIHQGAPAHPVAGPGRPSEHIRADMRSKLDELLPDVLERYRAGELDHVRVVEFLAKYGLGTKDEISVTDHPKFREAVAVVRAELETEFGADRVDAAIMRAQARLNA